MYSSLYFLCSIAITASGLAQVARAEEAVYVVAYIEVMPSSVEAVTALLRQYRGASRQEAGNVRVEVLQQHSREDHFVLLEAWQDQQTLEAHSTAASTRLWREKLQPLRVSPHDERLHKGLALGAMPATGAANALYVVTHADAIPPAKDEALMLLKQLAESSRQEAGNVGFEVLQQSNRQNHCTIVEIWQDQQAYAAHVMAAHTRQFRDKFQPMSGSLYDERLYKLLD